MRFFFILFSLLVLTGCSENSSTSEVNKPNVVVILTDDQGWGDLSYNGNTNLKTPNIDAIAKNGTVFNNFFVQPVCSPTRAELLTGKHFTRLGVYSTSAGGERMSLEEQTIADHFQNSGYRTAIYGKWHNGSQPPYHPNARGFDDFYGFTSGHWGNYFDPLLEHNGKLVQGKGFIVDDLVSRGIQFIEQSEKDPFFLFLPLNTPHSPMQVPDAFWERFENKDLLKKHRDSTLEDLNFTRAALAMVENIDHNVGRLIRSLEDMGLKNNTIVIYMSDNGPNGWRWNNGMRGKKGSTDEGGVKTPFFIQWPDAIPAGKKVETIASAIDVLPTLADLTGTSLDVDKSLDGKSLAPLVLQRDASWTERFVYNHWRGKTSIRSQAYRLDHENKLYDMRSDPSQEKDISKDYPEVLNQLREAKKAWLKETLSDSLHTDERAFPVGHPDFTLTQLPARDGVGHGNIRRSNRYPNCSYFTNWKSQEDFLSWDIEVLKEGAYKIAIYYACKPENVGTRLSLEFMGEKLAKTVTEAHDPSLRGGENDRHPRIESYIKDFKPLEMGILNLKKGKGELQLKAIEIPGHEAVEVRLLLLERIDD